MRKLNVDSKFIINTKFISLYFPNWITTERDKNTEWLFYKTYRPLKNDISFLHSDEFLSFKKVYILIPYKYLQFDIYESTQLHKLADYLISEEVKNDYIDYYITTYDLKYCIKYSKAEHDERDFLLQTSKHE